MTKKFTELKILGSRQEAERYKHYLIQHGISSCRFTITKGIDLETKRAINLYKVIVDCADSDLAIDRIVDLETSDEKTEPSENERCPVCRSNDSQDIPRSLPFRITAPALFFIPYFIFPRNLQCSCCSAT